MNPLSNGSITSSRNSKFFLLGKFSISYFSNLTAENLYTSLPEKIASYLQNCRDINSLKKLHACVITQGLERDIFLGSKLLNSFAKFNLLAESKWVFNKIINKNLSLWNSAIVGYYRADQCNEVLELYLNLRQRKIGIHSSSITFALKSCVRLGTPEFGRNLHTDAFKFGLSYDRFVGSSLIEFYSKHDQIWEAAKVFDEITDRDVVAYTSMITGYSQAGDRHASKAFSVASDMQMNGFEPNRVTLVSLLQCASRLRALNKGRSIHGYAIRRGVGYVDEVFETSLIDMYIKCGDPDRGAIIFDKASRKSTGSWNALMAGYLQLGHPLKSFNIFLKMIGTCELDLISLANGLLICADLKYLRIGKSIHCFIIQEGIRLDLIGTTALIDMYSKCKHLSAAMSLFSRTDVKDAALFNVMIAGYLQNGCVLRAIETFREMITCFRPNTGTIISVVSALSDMEDIRTSKSIHGYVFRQGLEADTDIANQFINMYAKCGFIGSAKNLFDWTKIKDRISWTSMMTALVNHGLTNEAIALFHLMQIENLQPDAITFTCLLQGLNQVGSLMLTRVVHARMYRVFLEKDVTLMNCLITTYGKQGKLNMARDLFNEIVEKHLSSWNTMIAAYGMHGDYTRAQTLFNEMKEENVSPDGVTFKSILSACSHNGLINEGLQAFSSMQKDHGIIPSDEHYSCLVDLLCRGGKLLEAYNLLEQFPLRKNALTLGTLLSACRIHGNREIGERVGRWLLQMEPENASAYCSVMNMYAAGERWDEVARIGALAKKRGLGRTPGYSLIDSY